MWGLVCGWVVFPEMSRSMWFVFMLDENRRVEETGPEVQNCFWTVPSVLGRDRAVCFKTQFQGRHLKSCFWISKPNLQELYSVCSRPNYTAALKFLVQFYKAFENTIFLNGHVDISFLLIPIEEKTLAFPVLAFHSWQKFWDNLRSYPGDQRLPACPTPHVGRKRNWTVASNKFLFTTQPAASIS